VVEYYALMYENGKLRPVELFQGWGGAKGEGRRVNSTVIHCKNFCKCHTPVYSNNKKDLCIENR
jgi:hypothetical protein